ncbi:hypothetical protein F4777DRAFT_316019 [Nemania sp. FL0916]|nr:hypothetical protein F4777DRAFT_316019 [Nemania sp. FL0916]
MASQREVAKTNWGKAQKIRAEMPKKLSNSGKERGNVSYTARFEETELTMAEYRLACMKVIFHDFEYAIEKKVENSLWSCHVYLNGEYRKTLTRLNAPSQAVQRRKLDKLYRNFLKTSEQFYFVYIQQLYSRFPIPELQQIAHRQNSAPVDPPAGNVCPPGPLRTLVLKSCQMTSVHLGDLARYRCSLFDKFSKHTFDTASDFYGLANSLDPDDGIAHHQLAVLHKIPSRHFDIVYHFHRAIAISKPHELALQNLELEFKDIESPSQSKKGASRDPSQAMPTWFVRLHAFFFHGNHFTQQSELEEEVLHRFELALKSKGQDDALLLKMIIINMAAYDIATGKVKSSWTLEASQSCQFLLRFNIRMMLVLLRALCRVLGDSMITSGEPSSSSIDGESCITFASSLTKLLPLFRFYLAWSYVTRADLVEYQEYLEPHIKEVYRLLADVLTSLNVYIDQTMEIVSSKYLLAEDLEAQGLRSLGDRRLPLFLHVEEQQGSVPPKRVKTRKPQQGVFGRRFSQNTETVWRIRDIICCGVYLAGSAKFPINLTTETKHGREVEVWVFVDGETERPLSSNEACLSRLLSKLNFRDVKDAPETLTEKEASKQPAQHAKNGPSSITENGLAPSMPQLASTSNERKGKSKANDQYTSSTNYQDSDVCADSEMVNMVDKLLGPIDDIRPPSSLMQTEPSYGMHSSTANEVFGNLETSPVQPSPVSKALPSLPWDYFYTPTPHRSNSHEQNRLGPNGHNVPRSATDQFNGLASSPYLEDLGVQYRQAHQSSLSPGPSMGYPQISPVPATTSPSLAHRDYGLDSLENSRNAVLDDLRTALLAQHGFGINSPSLEKNLHNHRTTSPMWGQQEGTAAHTLPQQRRPAQSPEYKHSVVVDGYLVPTADRQVDAANLPNPIGPPGQGRPGLGQTSSTTDAGHFPTAAYPSSNMNSGVQHGWGPGPIGLGRQQRHRSPWAHESPAATSSMPFSHPSSLITGTPGAAGGAPPAHSVACNGHYYNASTPFGRLGDGVDNRADPSHFRNRLKAMTGTSDIPYDQQILQSAMVDDKRKPRPK